MQRKPRLLIVEDELAIRSGLVDVFVYHGFEVEALADGEQGLARALAGRFDLLLLDVMLPGCDGYSICRSVRQHNAEQPIILLTAKSSDDDIIHGLSLGADDYVAKPFSVAQLVLRVQAVLRRSGALDHGTRRLTLGSGLVVDCANLVAGTGAEQARFTRREMDVLIYLADHHLRPVPREELLAKVWGYAHSDAIETRTVDIHVAKLRRKIEPDVREPRNLLTVRGGGYRLVLADG